MNFLLGSLRRFEFIVINDVTFHVELLHFYCRLAANFAEVRSVLSKFEGADFVPRTVLDYGSGCGGAFWAAHDLWGDQVEEYQLVEPNDHISKFCIDVLRVIFRCIYNA